MEQQPQFASSEIDPHAFAPPDANRESATAAGPEALSNTVIQLPSSRQGPLMSEAEQHHHLNPQNQESPYPHGGAEVEAPEGGSEGSGASTIMFFPETPEASYSAPNYAAAAAAAAAAASVPLLGYNQAGNVGGSTGGGAYYDISSTTPGTATTVANSAAPPPQVPSGQLVSHGGVTYLIHSGAGGGSPIITTLDGNGGTSMPPPAAAAAAAVAAAAISNGLHQPQQQQLVAQLAAAAAAANGGEQQQHQEGHDQQLHHQQNKGSTLSYATRVAPATIQWLVNNYETAEGVSLPRSTLYLHYEKHCADTKQEPVNAASFGKLIRSVFLGLRTRRIGTRGNSKYHYYGIRVKQGSEVSLMDLEAAAGQKTQQPVTKKRSGLAHNRHFNNKLPENSAATNAGKLHQPPAATGVAASASTAAVVALNDSHFGPQTSEIEGFPKLTLPPETFALGSRFHTIYECHCKEIFNTVTKLNFAQVEQIWRDFWQLLNEEKKDKEDSKENREEKKEDNNNTNDLMDATFKVQLRLLLADCEQLHEFVKLADFALYQKVVDFLMPKVLQAIPNSLTHGIRTFAKSLESWMSAATKDLPKTIRDVKLVAVRSLSQILRRYTGLNHLAQAARAVLNNTAQISQMLSDLNMVDFGHIQEQASWVCRCDASTVQNVEAEFKKTLQKQSDLEQWASWLEGVVDKVLIPHRSSSDFSNIARVFLMQWSFYSSLVIRDLTLRSAASFGSFHLIRLLYDEYIFYLVEKKVSSALSLTPVSLCKVWAASTRHQQIKEENIHSDREKKT